MSRFANILLDLDGTLTDPFEGICASVRHAMACMSASASPEDELRRAIWPSSYTRESSDRSKFTRYLCHSVSC